MLRSEMDKILRKWGHNVLLQRRVDDAYTNNFERHTVRHMYPSNRGLPRTMEERPEGLVNTVEFVYFFRWDAKPKELDRIYDEDPTGKSIWLIDYSLPMRGKGGEIVFWTVGVTREEPN